MSSTALLPGDLASQLAQLRRERDELAASLPAHSIPAAMLIRLEDLEDEIAALQAILRGGELSDSADGCR